MTRPVHLPEYANPPLSEVVIGVQFKPIRGFTSVRSAEIWNIFREEYPSIAEQPALEPQFETFGGNNPEAGMSFSFGPAPLRSRLWFMSKDDNHLFQFQEDRLLLNWRRQSPNDNYPHFEGISAVFEQYLQKLGVYVEQAFGQQLRFNQSEVSYLNLIRVDEFKDVSDWVNLIGHDVGDIDSFNMNTETIERDENQKPFARFRRELASVVTTDEKHKAVRLNLTFRGKPQESDQRSVSDFLSLARDRIVINFNDITTNSAHKHWKKKS